MNMKKFKTEIRKKTHDDKRNSVKNFYWKKYYNFISFFAIRKLIEDKQNWKII